MVPNSRACRHHPVDLGALGDVHLEGQAPCRPSASISSATLWQPASSRSHSTTLAPSCGELEGDASAHALCPAGDDRHFVLQIHHSTPGRGLIAGRSRLLQTRLQAESGDPLLVDGPGLGVEAHGLVELPLQSPPNRW